MMVSKIALLQAILNSYEIPGNVEDEAIVENTIVYKVIRQPEKGNTSLSKYAGEIARQLGAESITITKLPEVNAYGIVAPYRYTSPVDIAGLLDSPEFSGSESNLAFAVGKDAFGGNVIGDLVKMPHLLVGGSTDFGKSVFLDSLIISLLSKSSPVDVNLVLISPGSNSFSQYCGVPHLAHPLITATGDAARFLDSLSDLIQQRFASFDVLSRFLHDVIKKNKNLRSHYNGGVIRNIDDYNTIGNDDDRARMPRVVVIVDELADLMSTARDQVEKAVSKLGIKARAAGIHLVLATSRIDPEIITDTIKTYCPSRIAFKTPDTDGSRIILDRSGAEELLGGGDMLYQQTGALFPKRVQGAYISGETIARAVKDAIESHANVPKPK